jgi:hypothetical protein
MFFSSINPFVWDATKTFNENHIIHTLTANKLGEDSRLIDFNNFIVTFYVAKPTVSIN